jgi:hypothetical protein
LAVATLVVENVERDAVREANAYGFHWIGS